MPIPDFRATDGSAADGKIQSVAFKSDGGTEETLLYTVKMVFPITVPADAKRLSSILPGAVEVFDRVQMAGDDDVEKFSQSVRTPTLEACRVVLTATNGGDEIIAGAANIKAITLRASRKEVAAVVDVEFGGQTAQRAADLARNHRKVVSFTFGAAQGVLPFPRAVQPDHEEVAYEVGDVVCAKATFGEFWGRLVDSVGEDGKITTLIIEDLDGRSFEVKPFDLVSALPVQPADKQPTSAAIKSYIKQCRAHDKQPSWKWLILGLGEAAEEPGEDAAGNKVEQITDAVVEAAITLQLAEDGEADAGTTGTNG